MAVEVGDLAIVFIFNGELDARVYGVEAGEEIINCSLTVGWLNPKFGNHIIDVFLNEGRRSKSPLLSDI